MGYFRFDTLYHVDLASAQNLHGLQTESHIPRAKTSEEEGRTEAFSSPIKLGTKGCEHKHPPVAGNSLLLTTSGSFLGSFLQYRKLVPVPVLAFLILEQVEVIT